MKSVVCAALSLVAMNAMAAEPCMDNFSTQGNLLTGKSYKTWAVVPAVSRDEAFQRAHAFTVSTGFTILSADKNAGLISAAHGEMYAKGKILPLNIVLQPDGANVRLDIQYSASAGMISSESTIQQHFCKTVAAAGASGPLPVQGASVAAGSPAPAPANANAGNRRGLPGYAIATEAQLAAYSSEIGKNIANPKLRPLVKEATPAIAEFIGKVACLMDYKGASALNAHAAPNVNLQNRYITIRPVASMNYHDKGSCLSVARVHGWKSPANNALQFEVLYKADDSGETSKLSHEVVRQPDGMWMFTQ